MDLKQKFYSLYNEMVDSKDVKNMKLFGEVMGEMMERAIQRDTNFAMQVIEKLESMDWKQYLTKTEAEELCDSITPKYEWDFSTWERALTSLELETERKPIFNKYALWTLMNYLYSKHSETLSQKILEISAEDVSDEQMIQILHALAIDSLTDKDERFDIRKFFSI